MNNAGMEKNSNVLASSSDKTMCCPQLLSLVRAHAHAQKAATAYHDGHIP